MQKITLVCVGKAAGFYAQGVEEYAKRLAPVCKFSAVEVQETPLREKKINQTMIDAALTKESESIAKYISNSAYVIALCIEGKQQTSEIFSKTLQNAGAHLVFVIGSSHGLAPQIKARADLKLSLSDMTLPHQLARLLLMEQIYRGFMIQKNHPYHK